MSNIEKLADKRRVKPVRKSAVAEILEEQRKLEEEREAEDMRQIKEEFRKADWDVCASEPVRYFDANLSYEITGYKPIDGTHGLDFDPSWFTEVRETFLRTGHYSAYHRGTKAYADFWDREYSRCQDGMTVNGYTVTGDHYFFLNYYQLMDLTSAKKSGSSRLYSFPRFFVAQY